MNIKWFKLNPKAIIPTKTEAAAGFDIYTIENNIIMPPHSQKLFSTGLAVVPEEGWWLMVFDRGSTGSKGLHVHCGVIDNDYRGEIFICLKNDNPYEVHLNKNEQPGVHSHKEKQLKPIVIKDGIESAAMHYEEVEIFDYMVYPLNKAIAQIIPVAQPTVASEEISLEEWNKLKDTERGAGKLGSSGK